MKVVNTQTWSYPTQQGIYQGRVDTVVVLTQDGAGQFACYIGHGDDDWVMYNGQKLSYREAINSFPSLKEEQYRH